MKATVSGKFLIPVILVMTVVAGCATAPKETAPPAPAVDTGKAQAGRSIDSAKAAIAKAKSLDWIWRDTEKFLGEAETAFSKGDYDTATKLADKARNQAELAVNQYYLEQAKTMFNDASAAQGLTASQRSALKAAESAIRNGEGRKAYDLMTSLMSELRSAAIDYQVVRGDSLWSISGQPGIYNNPYQWPLIYKANRDKIKDADLIYPGQVFSVDLNPSAAEVERAVDHARNRGAWSIGVVEESDRRYLGSTLELR
jgi:nucleoid-associated protein YgaU